MSGQSGAYPVDELSPIFRSLTDSPINFLGGFAAGMLRLNLMEDPVRRWLVEQSGQSSSATSPMAASSSNGQGPRSIAID